jgi:hypothetical protein
MSANLFRARFPFVCGGCDLGYKAGRLAGWAADHTMLCAACLVGADPDNDTTNQETSSQCPTSSSTGATAPTAPASEPPQACLPGMPD